MPKQSKSSRPRSRPLTARRILAMEGRMARYPSMNTLKQPFTELLTSTPDSLMIDLERHLGGLAITQPPKKRVRFTVQQQRIVEGGSVRRPRLPTILLARTKNPDGSKPSGWQNLSRSPSPGISPSLASSSPGASSSCPASPSGSWRRRSDSLPSAEYMQSAPTPCRSSTEAFLGAPLMETLELRDEAWILLSTRLWDEEVVDSNRMMEY